MTTSYLDRVPRVTQARQPRTPPPRTLWEEGRHPGVLVVPAAAAALALVTCLSLLVGDRIGVLFDIVFVLTCIGAALAVRPRDFFTVGVLPPLLLAGTVLILALADRGAVARADDALAQALVSGLAHHALALVLGYGFTLAVLALRQVALRNRGQLRRRASRPHTAEEVAGAPADRSPGMPPAAAAEVPRQSRTADDLPRTTTDEPGSTEDQGAPAVR